MAVTIKDVALRANVSITTVSHVLNKTRFVAATTQQSVIAAVEELNYLPNTVAQSLKGKHTKSIGMLVTTTLNPFYAEVVKAVEKYCYLEGYNLVLCNTDGDFKKTDSYLKMLAQKRIDGVIIMCTEYDGDSFTTISSQSALPMVVMDWGPIDPHLDRIQDNSFQGGYMATQYLLENNHTSIGYIGGPLDKLPALNRYSGFSKAMADAQLNINPEWVIESDFQSEGGKTAMAKILALDELPTAIFVANDMMALGAMCLAQQSGLKIPDQLSIIGYDNISFSAYFSPPLTTINQPKNRLARIAVNTLIERLREDRPLGRTHLIEPDLVVRDSVAKLR